MSVIWRSGAISVLGCVAVVFLSSCATGAAVAGIAYTVQTGRLPTDVLVSALSNKDCNALRQQEDGGKWCRNKGAKKDLGASQPPVWCYRTLGEVNCYDRPLQDETAQLVQ